MPDCSSSDGWILSVQEVSDKDQGCRRYQQVNVSQALIKITLESDDVRKSTHVQHVVSRHLPTFVKNKKLPEKKSMFRSGGKKCPRTDYDEWKRNEDMGKYELLKCGFIFYFRKLSG